ncbi:hypothetical protein NE237_006147 [Protea cynaroides]|uniref:Uncharacterized protein n=1 Tax=Protea cynaroides TaxID=273540 RepID=A0A9Q0QV12_9MAGN|nr:hypothetical protein NE237_006147 [Protea cynaroides]
MQCILKLTREGGREALAGETRGEGEKQGAMVREAEALVVCSDKSMGAGITVWDMDAGNQLLHFPTCASPPHGLLCLKNQFLVASQVRNHGSFGSGAIFIWPFSKPHSPLRSYPMEAIGPLSSTNDGLYIVGGAFSGNAYVWEVSSGELLKSWCAHHTSLNCLAISDDNSLLISGSSDGLIRVWSMISFNIFGGSLLDVADCGGLPNFLLSWLAHQSAITGLLFISGSSNLVLISSSLDGTFKVWDLVSGTMLQSRAFPLAVTAVVLDPGQQLFSGSADGRIFVDLLDIGLGEDPATDYEDHMMVLSGHKASITALTFNSSGSLLISASEDCTVCLWDVSCWVVIRRFNHQKGKITNMVIVPQSSLLPGVENQNISNDQLYVSVLEKYPQSANFSRGPVMRLPTCLPKDSPINAGFLSTDSMNKQILELEQGRTLSALQMKVETNVKNRMWATSMTKHVTEMNKQLRSRLLDLMDCRLSPSLELVTSEKRKRIKINSPLQPGEEKPKSPT